MCIDHYRFLDKMYSMSSSEALVAFTRNPRAYLLPPQPRIPCKVCVVGPPTSGKSTLAQKVADHYNAMVMSYNMYVHVRTCTCTCASMSTDNDMRVMYVPFIYLPACAFNCSTCTYRVHSVEQSLYGTLLVWHSLWCLLHSMHPMQFMLTQME